MRVSITPFYSPALPPANDESDQGYETDQDTQSLETTHFTFKSSALPFGQDVTLPSIDGPTYVTAQTLVQHVAYLLSSQVFTYSLDSFDLDRSLKLWHKQGEKNAYGYDIRVSALETRAGAGSMALGYMLSKDHDTTLRRLPQSIVGSSAALKYLRPALEELSLFEFLPTPLVLHVAAVDYSASAAGFIIDYATPMALADELGLSLVTSTSTHEAQHMSLLATLFSGTRPAIHAYDGINVGRETTRVVDISSRTALLNAFKSISEQVNQKNLSYEEEALALLEAFNEDLGTEYRPFEYTGHEEAEAVLIAFGSVEGAISSQMAFELAKQGVKVGVINVRVYRPFIVEEFLKVIKPSVRHIAVLGQVKDHGSVADPFEHSKLYYDVLAALRFSTEFAIRPEIVDVKYSRKQVWTWNKMLKVFEDTHPSIARQISASDDQVQLMKLNRKIKKYTFWDVDDSPATDAAPVLSKLLAIDDSKNISFQTGHDNLAEGGIVRYGLRVSPASIDAPFALRSPSELVFVGDEKVLNNFSVLDTLKEKGTVLIRTPDSKEQELSKLEKRLPESFRSKLIEKQAELFLLDPNQSAAVKEDASLEPQLIQLAFLKIARTEALYNLPKLASINGSLDTLKTLETDLKNALSRVDLPEDWTSIDNGEKVEALPADLIPNSFSAFQKAESEESHSHSSWIDVAKGFAFKEATGSVFDRRPDLGIKTTTIHVKEHKRLTPLSYDRNIFHIEFDLGDSGLTYNIGEALGIHPENEPSEVSEFIQWYNLNPDELITLPSRVDPDILETRTAYQSLLQNIDLFGRPPKNFYGALAEYATDNSERKALLTLAGPDGTVEFKRRAEVDTVTYEDILREFPSAHPPFSELARMISPIKRREYSIASSQHVQPNSISLLVVTVSWQTTSPPLDGTVQSRDRFGLATRYLDRLKAGDPVTVSLKPSVMKLPASPQAPLILAGLGTGLAPFRAFAQERAWQRQHLGITDAGPILLFLGSRHKREEYLYGEEWEAFLDSGVVGVLAPAFSRDQPQKIYIQDRMRQKLKDVRRAWLKEGGAFYLCGPTWPVPDVTEVLMEALEEEWKEEGRKVKKGDARKEIEKMKDDGRYVLEVY